MKRILFLVFILNVHYLEAQDISSHFNGASYITGNLKPEGQTYGISLQNELIHVRALDSSVFYDVLYEFKNTTNSYGVVNVMQPITIYFNEFRPGIRAPMLDQLGNLFMDVFKVDDPSVDIRDQVKANFQQRLFIRRFVSTENLRALGIIAEIFKNNQRSSYKKVMVEFRWEDADPYNLNKNTEVLVMELKFTTDFSFNPDEQFNLLSFLKLPTTTCGINEKQIYAPYQIGYDKNWEGTINNIYIQHDIFKATPVLPFHYAYTNKYVGERDQVVIIKNVTPVNDERIAFYTIEENYQQCGKNKLVAEKSIIPVPVKNVSASSWVKTDTRMPNQNYVVTNEVAMSNNIQVYQTGNPTDLDMLAKDFQSVPYTSYLLNDYLTGDCKGESAGIVMKESGHPIYAFDISNFNQEDPAFAEKENLQMQTSWCEGVSGLGKGEYIEFELTQPVKAIKIYNGNHATEKIFNESSKVDIIRFSSPDGVIKDVRYSIIDLKIQNLYVMSLPAGKYRIYMDDVDDGKIPITCLSSITFDFDLQDVWYQKSITLLESVYKKPK